VANHKSSEKRARGTLKKQARNSNYLAGVRTATKKFAFAVNGIKSGAGKDVAEVEVLFKKAQSLLAKAAEKGMIHKNNAARKIGRLAAALKNLDVSAAPAGKAPKASKAKPAAAKPAKKTAAKKATSKSKKK